jgi:hypothetical protein
VKEVVPDATEQLESKHSRQDGPDSSRYVTDRSTEYGYVSSPWVWMTFDTTSFTPFQGI